MVFSRQSLAKYYSQKIVDHILCTMLHKWFYVVQMVFPRQSLLQPLKNKKFLLLMCDTWIQGFFFFFKLSSDPPPSHYLSSALSSSKTPSTPYNWGEFDFNRFIFCLNHIELLFDSIWFDFSLGFFGSIWHWWGPKIAFISYH